MQMFRVQQPSSSSGRISASQPRCCFRSGEQRRFVGARAGKADVHGLAQRLRVMIGVDRRAQARVHVRIGHAHLRRDGDFAGQLGKHRAALLVLRALAMHDVLEFGMACHDDPLKLEWGNRFHRIRRAVYDWPYKYIQSSDGAHELYDLERDPTEQTNLVKAKPEIAKRLHADVQDLPDSVEPPKTEAEVSDAEMEALRALGYVE